MESVYQRRFNAPAREILIVPSNPNPNPNPNPSPKQDPTDPFLHGITYHAMPPSKRFRAMSDLSTPTPSRTLSRTIPLDPNPNPSPNPERGPKH